MTDFVILAMWAFVILPCTAYSAYNLGKSKIYREWSADTIERTAVLQELLNQLENEERQRMLNEYEE